MPFTTWRVEHDTTYILQNSKTSCILGTLVFLKIKQISNHIMKFEVEIQHIFFYSIISDT